MQVKVGGKARKATRYASHVRKRASASGGVVGKFPAGAVADVLDGPVKANGYTWVKIRDGSMQRIGFESAIKYGQTVSGSNTGYATYTFTGGKEDPVKITMLRATDCHAFAHRHSRAAERQAWE